MSVIIMSVIIMSDIVMSVIMLSVIMLSVLAPLFHLSLNKIARYLKRKPESYLGQVSRFKLCSFDDNK